MLNDRLIQLVNNKPLNNKRVTQIFNREFNLDDKIEVVKLISLIEEYEKSLKITKKVLQSELSSRRTLVQCLNCKYLYKEEDKSNYFCLKAREFIYHEVDENLTCTGYKSQ